MRYSCGCVEEASSINGPGYFDPCDAHRPADEWLCVVCNEPCEPYQQTCERPGCLAEACSQGDEAEPDQMDLGFCSIKQY